MNNLKTKIFGENLNGFNFPLLIITYCLLGFILSVKIKYGIISRVFNLPLVGIFFSLGFMTSIILRVVVFKKLKLNLIYLIIFSLAVFTIYFLLSPNFFGSLTKLGYHLPFGVLGVTLPWLIFKSLPSHPEPLKKLTLLAYSKITFIPFIIFISITTIGGEIFNILEINLPILNFKYFYIWQTGILFVLSYLFAYIIWPKDFLAQYILEDRQLKFILFQVSVPYIVIVSTTSHLMTYTYTEYLLLLICAIIIFPPWIIIFKKTLKNYTP